MKPPRLYRIISQPTADVLAAQVQSLMAAREDNVRWEPLGGPIFIPADIGSIQHAGGGSSWSRPDRWYQAMVAE
jgi:hypothetical protein